MCITINTRKTVLNESSVATIIPVESVLCMAKTCAKFGKQNYFASVCKSSQDSTLSQRRSTKVKDVDYKYEENQWANNQ